MADHWDYVDRWTRNALTEQQLLDHTWLARATEGKPPADPHETTRISDAGKRLVGSFSYSAQPNEYWKGAFMTIGCCNGNASRALYYVWENIARIDGSVYRINLLLNHASRQADIDSFLPYEGRVIIRLKESRAIEIRLPNWVDPAAVTCSVDGVDRSLNLSGRYVQLGESRAGSEIELTFPMVESAVETSNRRSGLHPEVPGQYSGGHRPAGHPIPPVPTRTLSRSGTVARGPASRTRRVGGLVATTHTSSPQARKIVR